MPTPNILLVDDVEFFLEIGKDYLRNTPANVLTARNGREALQVAATARPDLIFLDVNMPVMDGLACCRTLKGDAALSHIPVIMLYAPSQEVNVTTCQAAGCDGVLTKPIDRKAFLEMGHRFLFKVERREKRVPCQMTVTFSWGDKKAQGMGYDLSEHGIYIQYRQPVPLHEKLHVSFLLPTITTKAIEARGRVAWVNQGFPRVNLQLPQGFGVELLSMDREAARCVCEYVERSHLN